MKIKIGPSEKWLKERDEKFRKALAKLNYRPTRLEREKLLAEAKKASAQKAERSDWFDKLSPFEKKIIDDANKRIDERAARALDREKMHNELVRCQWEINQRCFFLTEQKWQRTTILNCCL